MRDLVPALPVHQGLLEAAVSVILRPASYQLWASVLLGHLWSRFLPALDVKLVLGVRHSFFHRRSLSLTVLVYYDLGHYSALDPGDFRLSLQDLPLQLLILLQDLADVLELILREGYRIRLIFRHLNCLLVLLSVSIVLPVLSLSPIAHTLSSVTMSVLSNVKNEYK